MTFRIPQGKHRARPYRFWLWWGRKSFTWKVSFGPDCRYQLSNDDQYDTNKLIGIGYLPGHLKESACFGWRYWPSRDEIELSAYCYVKGMRTIQHIGFCQPGVEYRLELFVSKWLYLFTLDEIDGRNLGMAEVKHMNTRKLQYRLGTYFGGAVSPRDMHINIEKYDQSKKVLR